MDKLQILESEIRKDLPRLLEPKEGCWLLMKGYENIKFKIIHRRAKEFIVDDYKGHKPINYRNSVLEDYFEIIGHDILLTDVLEWMGNLLDFVVSEKGSIFREFGNHFVSRIDFSKPHLKDQSEELIGFLFDLIKK